MLKDGTLHHDLGAGYFDRRAPHIKLKRLVNQITRLGFEVTLQPIATAACDAKKKEGKINALTRCFFLGALATKQSIPPFMDSGLLRCARNDGRQRRPPPRNRRNISAC